MKLEAIDRQGPLGSALFKEERMRTTQLLLAGFLVFGLVSMAAATGSDDRFDPVLGATVMLKTGTLEPTRTEVSVPRAWRGEAKDDYDYFLVLTDGPATREARAALRAAGAEIVDYIPHNTYLVKAAAEALERIRTDVRWLELWHPYFKLHPELRGRRGDIRINIALHPGESPVSALALVQSYDGQAASALLGKDQWGVKSTVPAEKLEEISSLREVQWIEEDLPVHLHNVNAQWVTQAFIEDERPLWDVGLDGTGQIIEVNDSGVRTSHRAFRDGAIPIEDFGAYPDHRKIVAYLNSAPSGGHFGDESMGGLGHGTHVGGSVAGDDSAWTSVDGMAINAKLVVGDIGMANGQINSGFPYTMFNSAHQYGATIHNCSWGQDSEGEYRQYDSSSDSYMFYNQHELVATSAGNNPPNYYTGTPANAKSVLCVGASKNGNFGNDGDEFATWTARGPTDDGRYAPTLLAPGENISSCTAVNDNGYYFADGTSMSSPICAGNAAIIRQYYMEGWYPSGSAAPEDTLTPLGSLLKATLIASTRDPAGTWEPPSNRTGWGRIVTADALYTGGRSRKLWVYQNVDGFDEGEEEIFQITAETGGELKIVLVWSDQPGPVTGTGPKIKNDLDLEVEGPDAAVYLGNVFSGGESVTGGSADRLNTSEIVWLRTPQAGTYTITVSFYSSVQGYAQPFSIVAVGEEVAELGGDTEPPSIPTNVQLTPAGELSWDASTDNVGVAGYRIYRRAMAYFEIEGLTPLGTTTTETSYSVPGSVGDPATNYYFRISAFDAADNESDGSETVGEHDYEIEDGS